MLHLFYSTETILKDILPGACMAIWFVSLFLSIFKTSAALLLTQSMNLDILLKASAILFVSWSAVGDDKFDEPKFDSNRAKKRLSTYWQTCFKWMSLIWVDYISGYVPYIKKGNSYHKITNDYCCKEKGDTRNISDEHTIPHALYPFPAQHAEDNHETVHKIRKVPSRKVSVRKPVDIVCEITSNN